MKIKLSYWAKYNRSMQVNNIKKKIIINKCNSVSVN